MLKIEDVDFCSFGSFDTKNLRIKGCGYFQLMYI